MDLVLLRHSRENASTVDTGAGKYIQFSSSLLLSRSSGRRCEATMLPGVAAPNVDFFFFW